MSSPGKSADVAQAVAAVDGWMADLDVEGSHGPTTDVLSALATVLDAARWADVDRQTSKSLARRLVAAGADHENDTGEVGPPADDRGREQPERRVWHQGGRSLSVHPSDCGCGRCVPVSAAPAHVRRLFADYQALWQRAIPDGER